MSLLEPAEEAVAVYHRREATNHRRCGPARSSSRARQPARSRVQVPRDECPPRTEAELCELRHSALGPETYPPSRTERVRHTNLGAQFNNECEYRGMSNMNQIILSNNHVGVHGIGALAGAISR